MNKLPQFTDSDVLFLESQAENGKTATLDSSAAYIRNLDRDIKRQYEDIYQRLINEKFHLCYWCSNDVFVMVREVHQLYKTFAASKKGSAMAEAAAEELEEQAPEQQAPVVEATKSKAIQTPKKATATTKGRGKK